MEDYDVKGLMAVATAAGTAALQKEFEEEIFNWISVDPSTLDPIERDYSDYSDESDDDEPSSDESSSQDTSGISDSGGDGGGGGSGVGHAAWPTVEEYIEWRRNWTNEDMAGGESVDDILAGNDQVEQYIEWIAGLRRRPQTPPTAQATTKPPPKLPKKRIAPAAAKSPPEELRAPRTPSPPQKSGKSPSKAQYVSPLRPPRGGLRSSPPDTPRKTAKSPRKAEGVAILPKEPVKPQASTTTAPTGAGETSPAKPPTTPRKPARGPESAGSPAAVRKMAPLKEAESPAKQPITPKQTPRPPKSAGTPKAIQEVSPVKETAPAKQQTSPRKLDKLPKSAGAVNEPKGLASPRKTVATPTKAKKAVPPQELPPSAKQTTNIPGLAAQPKGRAETLTPTKAKPKKPKLNGNAVLTSFFTGGVNNTTPARTLKDIVNSSDEVLKAHPEYLDCMFPLPDAGDPVLTPAMAVKFKHTPTMRESFLQGYWRMLSFLGFAELPNGSVTQNLGFNPSEHQWTTVFDPSSDLITRIIRSMRFLGFESRAKGLYGCIQTTAQNFPSMPPGMKAWRRVTFRPVELAPGAMTPTDFKYPQNAPLPKSPPVRPQMPLRSTLQPKPPVYSFGGPWRGDSEKVVDPSTFGSYRGQKRDSPDSDTEVAPRPAISRLLNDGSSSDDGARPTPSRVAKSPPPSVAKPYRPALVPAENQRAAPTQDRQPKKVRFNEADLPPLSSFEGDTRRAFEKPPRVSVDKLTAQYMLADRQRLEAARIAKSKKADLGHTSAVPPPGTSFLTDDGDDLPDYTDDEDAATDVDEPGADDGDAATDVDESTDDYEPDPGPTAPTSRSKSSSEPSWFGALERSLIENYPGSGPSTPQGAFVANYSPLARLTAPVSGRNEGNEGSFSRSSAMNSSPPTRPNAPAEDEFDRDYEGHSGLTPSPPPPESPYVPPEWDEEEDGEYEPPPADLSFMEDSGGRSDDDEDSIYGEFNDSAGQVSFGAGGDSGAYRETTLLSDFSDDEGEGEPGSNRSRRSTSPPYSPPPPDDSVEAAWAGYEEYTAAVAAAAAAAAAEVRPPTSENAAARGSSPARQGPRREYLDPRKNRR